MVDEEEWLRWTLDYYDCMFQVTDTKFSRSRMHKIEYKYENLHVDGRLSRGQLAGSLLGGLGSSLLEHVLDKELSCLVT